MPLSIGSTSTFAQTRDEVITDALVNLGVVAPGKNVTDARTANLLTHGARALDRLVKSMDADGAFLWRVIRRTATVTSGTGTFATANDILDIDGPMGIYALSNGSDRTPVIPMSRDEWMTTRQANSAPADTGRPTRYYIEHIQAQFVSDTVVSIYLDRLADATYTVEYAAFTRSADFTSGATTPNFPTKWTSCLIYGLTAELAASYRQPGLLATYRQMFNEEKARLLADDTERGPMMLVPFGMGIY